MASENYELARKSNESFMAGGVRVSFPAFDDLPSKNLWFGTRRFEVDGEDYSDALAAMPSHQMQRGLGKDTVNFTVNDPKNEWYQILKPYEPVIEDSEVIVKECLRTEGEGFESEIVMVGFLEQMGISDKNLAITFSAESDMSRQGQIVGGRILTLRYCIALFNINGLKNPLTDPCGWQISQGGNPLYCSHKRKGPDGCEEHMNDPRLLAVEALQTAPVTTVTGGGTGFEYHHNCFTPETLIWMADGSHKPIYQVEKGDIVWSFKPSGEIVKRKVTNTFKHIVGGHLVFDFGKGRILKVTPEHMMATSPSEFAPADNFDAGDSLTIYKDGKWSGLVIRQNSLQHAHTRVHNFEVEETETYFVIISGIPVAVHNRKQDSNF